MSDNESSPAASGVGDFDFFDGAGNWDEISFPSQGFKGTSFRLLNRETGEWSIYLGAELDHGVHPHGLIEETPW
jgi:hypothetical protein